tara:strand:+ start:655 stop:879 length:225 start_codon:yes stop_codon:yes gene_type:complete
LGLSQEFVLVFSNFGEKISYLSASSTGINGSEFDATKMDRFSGYLQTVAEVGSAAEPDDAGVYNRSILRETRMR